ncbi:Ecp42 [Fulvia fulva]|uniref:Ecp42 n=1 Tax=Passalora fulva TaxID=5499 RepID=A0A1P8YXL7_PASFU|nr:Ecp42 [Fulvia fulva]AQA29254.1 extracellular protein 42 [Fulvia fulva]KAK4632044.1 Ecp42 [Fulvia fulva]KAK4633329.1 Ecp42 [Fulvia fulva]UJO13403.1 Ecp42 [Fulvia fulva]WPV10999.1 Ecp42 [Fulvia fulva]
MLASRMLLFAFTLQVFAADPFCDDSKVCTPCMCNAAGRCQGFCHTVRGSSGPSPSRFCDTSADNKRCGCPTKRDTIMRRGACMSTGGIKTHPITKDDCALLNQAILCETSSYGVCQWDYTRDACYPRH